MSCWLSSWLHLTLDLRYSSSTLSAPKLASPNDFLGVNVHAPSSASSECSDGLTSSILLNPEQLFEGEAQLSLRLATGGVGRPGKAEQLVV